MKECKFWKCQNSLNYIDLPILDLLVITFQVNVGGHFTFVITKVASQNKFYTHFIVVHNLFQNLE